MVVDAGSKLGVFRSRARGRKRWGRMLASALIGVVLAGTLVPMVQAAPIYRSIFEVLQVPFCASEDPDAPGRPHGEHAHCVLCVGLGGPALPAAGISAVDAPERRPGCPDRSLRGGCPGAHYLDDAKGCRGPPHPL